MVFSNQNLLPHILTDIQRQVLIGGLLGDASLSKDGKYPRMKIDRQFKDEPYLVWQYNVFSDLCKSGVKEFDRFDHRYSKSHRYISFRTRAVPAFLEYHNKWYPNNIRQVPEDLELTPLILAVWFADDGCIINGGKFLTLKLSTESFGESGARILSYKLEERFNEKFPIYRKNKNQFIIKTSTAAAIPFIKDIEPDILKINMFRKHDTWKDYDLDKMPDIGRPFVRSKLIDILIISLPNFSIKEMVNLTKIDNNSVKWYINKLYKRKYLNRYESDRDFNAYRYYLTDTGIKFLN